jgi:hypothetical protein
VSNKSEALADWLKAVVRSRKNVALADLPALFGFAFEEPSRDEFEKHRRAAALIAHLPELYQKALKVLKNVDIDLMSASETAITSALRKHKMPRLCITCLNKFSLTSLVTHLVNTTLADDSHIYSLDQLKEERELVREKVKEGSEEAHMLKIVCAVKFASLIQLPFWAWSAIGTRIKRGRRGRRAAPIEK